jgi:hypothetical protein
MNPFQLGITAAQQAVLPEQTRVRPCNMADEDIQKLHGLPKVVGQIECEFLNDYSIRDAIASRKVIDFCDTEVKAIWETPTFHASPIQKCIGCESNDDVECGKVTARVKGYQMVMTSCGRFSYEWDPYAMCGKGGECGANPMSNMGSMAYNEMLKSNALETFDLELDARFMRYIINPVAANLAIAQPTFAVDADGFVDREQLGLQSLVTDSALVDPNQALGYDDTKVPTEIAQADMCANFCVSCLDGQGMFKMMTRIERYYEVERNLKSSQIGPMMILAHPNTIAPAMEEYYTRGEYCCQVADPFAAIGRMPMTAQEGRKIYRLGNSEFLATKHIPEGQLLVLPKIVMDNIWLWESAFEMWTNDATKCGRNKYTNMERKYGWFIPDCFREMILRLNVGACDCTC